MSAPNAIEVHGLEYSAENHAILHGIDLDVRRGEVLSVMGMSGSGKTTLLKCLAALIRPTRGTIALDGDEIGGLSESKLERIRLKIGMVFQYAALFDSMDVRDNVAFGLVHNRRMTRREIDKVVTDRLAEVDMEGTEALFPSQLSGGMQKRVGLARALAMEPSVLLYDEPTSGLDPVIARTIDDLIVRTRDRLGVTSVVVSHDVASVFRISDRVAMIHEGSLIAVGTPEQIKQSDDARIREFVA